MLFSEKTLKDAWVRAGGRCESLKLVDGKKIPCKKMLHWDKHGMLHEEEGWLGRHRVILEKGIIDIAANCEIVCRECHQMVTA
jgi:hypothetical protein